MNQGKLYLHKKNKRLQVKGINDHYLPINSIKDAIKKIDESQKQKWTKSVKSTIRETFSVFRNKASNLYWWRVPPAKWWQPILKLAKISATLMFSLQVWEKWKYILCALPFEQW